MGKNKWLEQNKKIKHSPDLNFINSKIEINKHINSFKKGKKNLTYLDVGGSIGKMKEYASGCKYNILQLSENKYNKHPDVIYGDICDCPQIPDESYDIIFSYSVFEHIKEPWKAAKEMVRINKTGGINVHLTLFSWRYHPVPVDCFRFTHTGMKILFEQNNNMKEILVGYDITSRRTNFIGGKLPHGLDKAPVDNMGGWRENWRILYIGQKI